MNQNNRFNISYLQFKSTNQNVSPSQNIPYLNLLAKNRVTKTVLTLIWVGGGGWGGIINPSLPPPFSNIILEIFVPNLVFLSHPSLQILGKTQMVVFPISGFLDNVS